MKHCILVKWNALVEDKKAVAKEVEILFKNLLCFREISDVEIIPNVVERSNRFDLLIRIDMPRDFLVKYDDCETHHEWKEKYGKFVENKAIFDYEE